MGNADERLSWWALGGAYRFGLGFVPGSGEGSMTAFPVWAWFAFAGFVLVLLALDLFVLHRKQKGISFREAALLSGFWVALAVAFGGFVLLWAGPTTAGEYFAGYVIEKALSVDNVFVFALIFSYFAVPLRYQYRVLFWGVVGALVLRVIFILVGTELLERTTGWYTCSALS